MQTTGLVSSIPTRIGTGRDRTSPPFADRSRPWIMPLHPTIAAFTRRRPDRGEARHTGADTLRGDGSAVAGHRIATRRSPGPSPPCRPTSLSPCWLNPPELATFGATGRAARLLLEIAQSSPVGSVKRVAAGVVTGAASVFRPLDNALTRGCGTR